MDQNFEVIIGSTLVFNHNFKMVAKKMIPVTKI